MTTFEKVTEDITHYKPKMHQAKALKEVPFVFGGPRSITVQVKADGEFNYVKYQREGQTYALNRFGRKTTDLPALKELVSELQKWNIVEAEFLAEMYAFDPKGEKAYNPLTLPNLIHFLKGTDKSLQQQIKLGLFELLSVNGKPCNLIYPLKYEQMIEWFAGASLVHVLSYSEPTSFEQVEKFWEHNVVQLKWEGLVIRLNGDIWKVKPNCDVDVAIIGVNKNNKGYEEGKAKSLKMALMNEEGDYVEIGDCSGIGEDESKELFELTKTFKIGEDSTTVFVQPIVITTVEYIQTYPDTRNKVYRIESVDCVGGICAGMRMREVGEATLVRLRNPHVKGYRADKKACLEDIGLNQVS
jgi:ATP-dependent DNA ligase